MYFILSPLVCMCRLVIWLKHRLRSRWPWGANAATQYICKDKLNFFSSTSVGCMEAWIGLSSACFLMSPIPCVL